jgi:hypothetical protein
MAGPTSAASLPLFLQGLATPAIQAKLLVNQPGDAFEHEADAVSEAAARNGDGARRAAPRAGARQQKAPPASEPAVQPPDGGSALSRNVRARVEPLLDMDLSGVRVHDSPEARDAAGSIGARAFTHRNHIWLGPNESADDAKLLTHEATHVRQQSESGGAGDTRGHAPAIQRQTAVASSSPASSSPASSPVAASMPGAPASSVPASFPESVTTTEPGDATDPSMSTAGGGGAEGAGGAAGAEGAEEAGGAGGGTSAETGEGAAEGGGAGGGETSAEGRAEGAGTGGGGGGGGATTAEADSTAALAVEETGAGALETGDLVLIDVELAEHQRWAGALGRVGEASSLGRAEFIAEAVGSGFISGAASGLAMGLGIGLVSRAVPAIGPVIGGAMALHGLVSRDWAETGATIGRFGEGNSTYETLANTIASVAAVIDVVSQVLTVINGIVGVVQIAAAVIAGGAVVAAFFTFGATLGIAAVAADVVAVCEEISLGINAVTAVLDTVNAAILQPAVTLFRALHAFTTQADPREVEAQGRSISTAAANSGAALGAWAGGRAAHIGAGGAHPSEDLPPSQRPPHETPPPAAGDGPTVRFSEPPAAAPHAEGAPAPIAHAEGAPPPVARAEAAPSPVSPVEASAPPMAHADTAPPPAAPMETAPTPVAHAESAPPPVARPESAPLPAAHAEGAPPPADAAAPAAAPEPPGTGMRIETHGDPAGNQLAHMTEADIDAALGGIDSGGARSDTFFELPGQNPRTGGGLQAIPDAHVNPNPNQITYSQNMYFSDVGTARIADAGDVPIGAPRAPGDSIIPAGVGVESPVPRTSVGGAPPSGNVEVRYHSANPNAPAGSYSAAEPTVQVNTPQPRFGWAGNRRTPVAGDTGRYLLPDGRWVTMRGATPPERAAAHWPVGASGPGPHGGPPPGPHGGGGAPPPGPGGGGGAPPVAPAPPLVPPAAAPVSAPPPVHTAPEAPVGPPPPSSTGGGGGTPPAAPQRILVVGAERPAEFQYATERAAAGNDVTVVNPQATPESAAFSAAGGTFVEAGIETLPQRPGYNVVSEDFPVPIRRMFPQARDMATERISRLEPGGRWVVTTESSEFVQMLEIVGRMQGTNVTSHEVPPHHEATPNSPHVVEQTRFIVVVERPNAPAGPPAPRGAPPPAPARGTPPPAAVPPVHAAPAPAPASPAATPAATTPAAASRTPSTFSAAAGAARTAVAGSTGGTGGSGGSGSGGEVSWGTRAHQVGELFLPQVFGSGGPAPTYAEQQAAHRARFTGDNQPAEGVERVNPEYPPPPGTPEQITAIQNEIMNLLTVRAAAEQEADHQRGRADRCEENQGPIQQTVQDTASGISAVQAHDAAVARRTAVNQEQQQRQQESQGLVAGYPSRATGLVALSVPLDAWAGFTSLASHLPGEAGDSMLRMNQEARQMQDAFTQMGAEMLGVETAGPAREVELHGDQGRLESTAEQAAVSDGQLDTASEGAAGLQDANQAALAEANQREEAATGRGDECSEAVAEREARAESLSEQLRVWAAAHAAARQAAIAATEQRLVSEGRTVLGQSER